MAKVSVAKNITSRECLSRAREAANLWEVELTKQGSRGSFEVAHGAHFGCDDADAHPYKRGLWIHVQPTGCRCLVFRSRGGRLNWYAGRTRYNDPNVWAGPCACGQGH
jgi:hypothetical protein